MADAASSKRDFLRHTIATLAYRSGKVLRSVPDDFGSFRISPGSRSAGEILAHMGDLMDWVLSQAKGAETWNPVAPRTWEQDVVRFFDGLNTLDQHLASSTPLGLPEENLYQGGVADALTHVGQIALLRRLAGSVILPENYAAADIAAGRVGSSGQSSPVMEYAADVDTSGVLGEGIPQSS